MTITPSTDGAANNFAEDINITYISSIYIHYIRSHYPKNSHKTGISVLYSGSFLVFIILLSDGFFTAIEIKLEVSLIYCPILFLYARFIFTTLIQCAYPSYSPHTHYSLDICPHVNSILILLHTKYIHWQNTFTGMTVLKQSFY